MACGIKFPDQGSNPGPLHWEHAVLATGPPGKSQGFAFLKDTFRVLLLLVSLKMLTSLLVSFGHLKFFIKSKKRNLKIISIKFTVFFPYILYLIFLSSFPEFFFFFFLGHGVPRMGS